MTEYAPSQGISVQNTCYHCALVSEYSPELRCLTCDEDKEGRDDTIAYGLVDEGSMQYKVQWSRPDDEPSASDWVASETIDKESKYVITLELIKTTTGTYTDTQGYTREYNENWCHIEERVIMTERETKWLIRKEFTPPIVQLVDGGELDNLWELEDYTQRQRETICHWCNLLTPKMFNDCQVCDKPLEHNLV